MNLGENKVPRKRRSIGDTPAVESEVSNTTQPESAESVEPAKKKGLFGKSKSENKKPKRERPRRGADSNNSVSDAGGNQESDHPVKEDRPRKDRATRSARPRRGESEPNNSAEASMEDLMQDTLLASTNELPDLDTEITLQSSAATVDKYVFDNNITEHQIRHRRVKEVAKIEPEDEIVNSISSAGLDLDYLDDSEALLNLDSLVTESDVDTSMFEKTEEEAFIDALISGTADVSKDKEDKAEESINPIEVTTRVGMYEGSEDFDSTDLEGIPEEPVLEEFPEEQVSDEQTQYEQPSEEPVLEETLDPVDPIDDIPVQDVVTPKDCQTVFEMLQDLHNELEDLTRNKCLSEQDLRLELLDDHLGRIEKAGVYDFTLPIYKVYHKGYAIPMNNSFEYAIPDGAEVEVDFGLRVFIPEGHILSVGSIGELEDKMHVQFEGKHYFNDREAFAGVRLKVKSLSPLSYLPAKFPTFKGTVIRNEKAS